MLGVIERDVRREALAELSRFRGEFYACLTVRGDSLFELAEALLCVEGSVKTLVGLALAPEHRRGHGALYAGLNQGRLDVGRLRRAPAGLPLPRAADGRLVLAVDVSPWLRPDAATPPDRSFCHTYGRGEQKQQMIPGWPYSVIAALETGRTSWTGVLDTQRLEPGADVAAVTAVQVREPVDRLIAAGQWHEGDPLIWVVVDAGYDVPRLAHLLRDLPVEVLGRLRSDRVMRRPAPPRWHGINGRPGGRPGRTRRAICRSSPAPSSACRSSTCRAVGTQAAVAVAVPHRRHYRRRRTRLAGISSKVRYRTQLPIRSETCWHADPPK